MYKSPNLQPNVGVFEIVSKGGLHFWVGDEYQHFPKGATVTDPVEVPGVMDWLLSHGLVKQQ